MRWGFPACDALTGLAAAQRIPTWYDPERRRRGVHPHVKTDVFERAADRYFCDDGQRGAGAFRALKELRLRIPHDVSFLTFDDYSLTSLVDPPPDVITQPVEQIGQSKPCWTRLNDATSR